MKYQLLLKVGLLQGVPELQLLFIYTHLPSETESHTVVGFFSVLGFP